MKVDVGLMTDIELLELLQEIATEIELRLMQKHKFRDKHPRDIRKEISAGGDACIIPGFLYDEVMS